MTFADRLKLALSEIPGATQADLARACQVKSSSCSAWFSGDSDSMRASVMLRAAKFLEVSPTWLVFGTGPMRGASLQAREMAGLYSIPESDWPFRSISKAQWGAISGQAKAVIEVQILALVPGSAREIAAENS